MSALTPWEPLMRWNPWKELEELEKRLSTFLRRPSTENGGKEMMKVTEWSPLVDITEDDKEYIVKAENVLLPKRSTSKATISDFHARSNTSRR